MNYFRFPLVVGLIAISSAGFSVTMAAQQPGPSSHFQVDEKTQIPGRTLKPGGYSIVLLDRLSDRMVLHVVADGGKDEATFLAVAPTAAFPAGGANGPIAIHAKGKDGAALRGFIFADGTRTEFVYQKQDAAALAKANGTTMVAIDPASEGRPAKDNLSATDRQMVSLWMLTPTVVGKAPAMEARRYESAPGAVAVAPAVRETPGRVAPVVVARNDAPRPNRVAHSIAVLPHTASEQPLLLLLSGLSIGMGAFLSLRRRMSVSSR